MKKQTGIELEFFGVKTKMYLREFQFDKNIVSGEREVTLVLFSDILVEGTVGTRITLPLRVLDNILGKENVGAFLFKQQKEEEKIDTKREKDNK